jgi:hypothetical protein
MLSEWKVTRVAFDAVSKLLGLQLRGDGPMGDDAAAIPEDDAQFLGQFGVAIRPVVAATLEALGYQDGDEVRVLKLWDKARAPTDLEAGETRLYAVGAIANVVRLLAARVVVEAPEIRLGANATKKVNREGDTVDCGTLVFTPNVGMAPAVLVYAPPGTAVPPAVPPAVNIPLVGRTGPGSNKVRAED